MNIHTDLQYIANMASNKNEENDHFRQYLTRLDGTIIDATVHEIYTRVNAAVSCTDCGNCCNHLVVNITPEEIVGLSNFLQKPEAIVREEYIEESLQGACYINTIPCHFFSNKKCTIYTQRFTECRDFPHLHKPGFRERLLGTLLHYPACPIIYNVVEQAKTALGFKELE